MARYLTEVWATIGAPAMAADLDMVFTRWGPDLVIRGRKETTWASSGPLACGFCTRNAQVVSFRLLSDNREFGGPLAAGWAGLPFVNHGLGVLLPHRYYAQVAEVLQSHLDGRSPACRHLGGLFHSGYLDICPPSLRGQPLDVVLTVGPTGNAAALGPLPDNVRCEHYVSQRLLFPHCDLVISHGGSGTMLTALNHGLPQLVLPQGADQFINAERLAAQGACLSILPPELHPDRIRSDIRRLLDDQSFCLCAEALQGEIEAMPGAHEVAGRLADLVGQAGNGAGVRP